MTALYDGIWEKPHDPGFIKNASVEETAATLADFRSMRRGRGAARCAMPLHRRDHGGVPRASRR